VVSRTWQRGCERNEPLRDGCGVQIDDWRVAPRYPQQRVSVAERDFPHLVQPP